MSMVLVLLADVAPLPRLPVTGQLEVRVCCQIEVGRRTGHRGLLSSASVTAARSPALGRAALAVLVLVWVVVLVMMVRPTAVEHDPEDCG
ncbi:hypothetical protein, partial [Streptomyces sp. NPDC029674]|uniref:hypothetical protein n=1 Tax=Streptomyces sp. NPDC029674 TaxID=3365297 RepID=UPI00384FC232